MPDHVPDGQRATGAAQFDNVWSLYAETPEAQHAATSPALARNMLAAPTPFSWRTRGSELLLWKRDGWVDAQQLRATISCVTNLLGLAEAYQHSALGE